MSMYFINECHQIRNYVYNQIREVLMKYRLRVKVFSKYGVFEGIHVPSWSDSIFSVKIEDMRFSFPLEEGCHISVIPEIISGKIKPEETQVQMEMFATGSA